MLYGRSASSASSASSAASASMPTPKPGHDRRWEQIDHIPGCRTFQVEQCSAVMVDEIVVWDNKVTIREVDPEKQVAVTTD